jgi:hypothetical protein
MCYNRDMTPTFGSFKQVGPIEVLRHMARRMKYGVAQGLGEVAALARSLVVAGRIAQVVAGPAMEQTRTLEGKGPDIDGR